MSERWGDSKRDRDALDRYITREEPFDAEVLVHDCLTCEGEGWYWGACEACGDNDPRCPHCEGQSVRRVCDDCDAADHDKPNGDHEVSP